MSEHPLFEPADAARRPEPAGEDAAQNLVGSLLGITFRNEENGYTVARVLVEGRKEPVTAVGVMAGVVEGDTVALAGRWVLHPSFGRQLQVERCELRLPHGRVGLVRFLGGGRFHGIGPVTAERIVDALGPDALEKIETQPAVLDRVPNLKRAQKQVILEQLHEQRAAAEALVFLVDHGLGPAHSQRVWRRYREATVGLVRADPWRLAEDIVGIGFKTADALAQRLGHAVDAPERVAAGLLHLLASAALEGHVGLPRELLAAEGARFLGVDETLVESVLRETLQTGRLVDDELVYRPELLAAEKTVALGLRRLLAVEEPLVPLDAAAAVALSEGRQGLTLSEDQRRALTTAVGGRVSVITGGPGVGKTTIVRCLVDLLRQQELRVALAAPTGRAARRLEQATSVPASTLHRLLGLQPGAHDLLAVPEHPLEADVLVVDEVSMVDIALMAAVVSALPDGAGLILVGDVDQLPSVGPGAVLAGCIGSGVVPVARLGTIFRQAEHGGIVRVAHQLNAGEAPEFDEGPDGEAFFVERDHAPAALAAITQLVVERIPRRFRLHPLRDVQVLTPMHGGPLGTVALNDALRAALNPAAEGRPEITRFGRLYRQGDKLMQVRNNYDLNVFNGDIGVLARLDLDAQGLDVDFDGRRVHYELDDLDQLEPAYAITCHKSQGSEFPAVVLALTSAHHVMLRRNLVYTAFTRARRALVAVGQLRALAKAAATVDTGARHGRLAERLRG